MKDLNKYCVFFYKIKSINLYSFAIGSNRSIYLAFDQLGSLVKVKINLKMGENKCQLLFIHTKLSDIVVNKYIPVTSSNKISNNNSDYDNNKNTKKLKMRSRNENNLKQQRMKSTNEIEIFDSRENRRQMWFRFGKAKKVGKANKFRRFRKFKKSKENQK